LNPWDTFQQVASITRHIAELQRRVESLEEKIDRQGSVAIDRFQRLELDLERIKERQAAAEGMARETIRAEIALAVADLRVRYEQDLRSQRRELPE